MDLGHGAEGYGKEKRRYHYDRNEDIGESRRESVT